VKKSKLPKGADDANDAALWQAVMGGGDGRGNGVSSLEPCARESNDAGNALMKEMRSNTVKTPCSYTKCWVSESVGPLERQTNPMLPAAYVPCSCSFPRVEAEQLGQ